MDPVWLALAAMAAVAVASTARPALSAGGPPPEGPPEGLPVIAFATAELEAEWRTPGRVDPAVKLLVAEVAEVYHALDVGPAVVTSLHRPGDSGPHGDLPTRAADVRTYDKPLEAVLSAVAHLTTYYDTGAFFSPTRPMLAALYEVPPGHEHAGRAGVTVNPRASGPHIHVQRSTLLVAWSPVLSTGSVA